ncbi:hypothetical protein KY331_01670 [Candidatus Woesearchaeota archaeon]|nr:hypothetical protein [Candidatus Woesearchaeota archaeon]
MLKQQKDFLKKHPKYAEFGMKHPWLPGIYLIIGGIVLILFWYYRLARGIFRLIHPFLHIIGILSVLLGIYALITFLINPEKARKKAKEFHETIMKK